MTRFFQPFRWWNPWREVRWLRARLKDADAKIQQMHYHREIVSNVLAARNRELQLLQAACQRKARTIGRLRNKAGRP